MEKARDTIRNLSDSEKKDGVTVYLREGDYRLLTAGFELTSEDSGTAEAPIVYAAYEEDVYKRQAQSIVQVNGINDMAVEPFHTMEEVVTHDITAAGPTASTVDRAGIRGVVTYVFNIVEFHRCV